MKRSQIAAQLYTVRDFCKTSTDLAKTLCKLRDIGYPAVQVSGIGAEISPNEVRTIADDAGVTICATHESGDMIRHRPLEVVEKLQILGVTQTAYPYPAGVDFKDPAAVKAMVSDLDAAGAILRENGCVLSYHNHAIEFLRIGEETLMDYMVRATSPENLRFELDTYWVQFGGADPVAWCHKVAGRLDVLHCKDYAFSADNQPVFAEVGHGNLNFPAIIAAADSAGAKWFIVEQDTCPGDPFVSLEKSYQTMSERLATT